MIKNSFRNFFKNLAYIFVPMGIFYFGALLTIFYFSRNFLINVTDAGNELITYINANASTSEIAIKDFIDYAINQINWNNNIYEVIKEIIQRSNIPLYKIAIMTYIGQAAIVLRTRGLYSAKTIHSTMYELVETYKRDSNGDIIINPIYNIPEVEWLKKRRFNPPH